MKKLYALFFLFSISLSSLSFSPKNSVVHAQQSDTIQTSWNLFEINSVDGTIGNSGVNISKNSDGSIHVYGTARQTSIKNLGDVDLDAGEYTFRGLSNQEKNTIALQLWNLDKNNTVSQTITPQIGFYDSQSFCIEEKSSVRVRIIVYQGANVDVTCLPTIERKSDNIISYQNYNENCNGVEFKTLFDNIIAINGTSTKTFIKQISDIEIVPGEYTLYGLHGLQKNTAALQLWHLDKNNQPTSLVCGHVGNDLSYVSFTIDETVKLRLRFIVYGESQISVCCSPTIICNQMYPRIEGNLINFINIKGEIGKSGAYLSVQHDILNITGSSSSVGVRVFGTVSLYPGTYCYSGLAGMAKNSLALQLWEVDENGKEMQILCAQIGTIERNQMQFTITKRINAVCRIIVYAGVLTNVSCKPCITRITSAKCDFQSINLIDDKVNVLVMEEGYQRYTVYRQKNKDSFEKIGSQKEAIFYDTDINKDEEYSYYYIGDGVIESEVRDSNFNSKNCASVACLMYHYFMTEDDLNNGGLSESYVYVDEFEDDLKYLKNHNIETIFCSDLIDFLRGEITLPERCVLIVIDDGHYSVYKYVLPLLEKYDCKANATIIGQFADRATNRTEVPQNNYWMTWNEIGELSASGYFEIGSHTYYLHNNSDRIGAHKKDDETDEEYREVLLNDGRLINEKLFDSTGYNCYFFAYPYNNPSLIGVDYMHNDLDYQLFFVGDANYWDYTKTRCNYFVKGTYGINPWWLIRRASRRTREDFGTFLNDIFENQNSQY